MPVLFDLSILNFKGFWILTLFLLFVSRELEITNTIHLNIFCGNFAMLSQGK